MTGVESQVPWIVAARGQATSFVDEPQGELWEINDSADVLRLMELMRASTIEPPIVLVHEAGGTTVGPLLEDIGGVISTTGTVGAHVALLAKEYGCACIVGSEWRVPVEDVDRVRLGSDGTVWGTTKGDTS